MMLFNKPLALLRYGLVFLTWGWVTWNYYSFSHFVHHQSHHFEPPHKNQSHHFEPSQGNHSLHYEPPHGDSQENGKEDNQHGHGGFNFDLDKDKPFLFGLALPLVLLTLASLVWNPTSSTKGTTTKKGFISYFVRKSQGEVNVKKWTIIWFLLPLLFVMFDSARGHGMSKSQGKSMGWDLYIRVCMSLMSPSGYAATWALALFLIPVTKHSPILDWLRVTPVQALAFHRIAGWTSFWYSVLHGFLHLRHLVDVKNPGHSRSVYQQLKILLIPSSWKCFETQNPFEVFLGHQDPYRGTSEEASQCWLALVNATGMISVLAFVALAITSLPWVRRYSYALFYSVHIPSAWIMLIMAIWHYPTCALILIPNIIYYLSFNIPLFVTQSIERWRLKRKKAGPLVEANLIQGGSIELIFAATSKDRRRHESRFLRVSSPSICPLSHPFSLYSRQDLVGAGDVTCDDELALTTVSLLLRPTGPFTEGLTKVLFPHHVTNNQEAPVSSNCSTDRGEDESFGSLSEPLMSTTLLSSHNVIQVDSYYAASFDWIDRAMLSHDEILLVAGGVGIVPFLEMLPSLQRRIQKDTMAAARRTTTSVGEDNDGSLVNDETTSESDNRIGPDRIHLHWYCREIGLASYVWHNYLRCHVQQAWENNTACQGRLKIHLHLTSVTSPSSSTAEEARVLGEEILATSSNSGLAEKYTCEQGSIQPVQDARFTQSRRHGLLLPGSLMVIGTILHWWWYKQFVLDEKFRDDNLVIRSHSVIFTLLLAMVLSVLVEHYIICKSNKEQTQYNPVEDHSDDESPSEATTASTTSTEHEDKSKTDHTQLGLETISGNKINIPTSLIVSAGRPPINTVIGSILKADLPGVYSCGPHALMESVEGSIRLQRSDCAFYREDSEM